MDTLFALRRAIFSPRAGFFSQSNRDQESLSLRTDMCLSWVQMKRFPRVFPKAMPCSAQARQHAGDCSRVPCDECPCEHRGCPFKCLRGNGRPPLEHSREPTPHGQQPFRVLDRFPSTSPSQRRSGTGEGGEGGRAVMTRVILAFPRQRISSAQRPST